MGIGAALLGYPAWAISLIALLGAGGVWCCARDRVGRSRKVSPTPRKRISGIGRLRSTRSAQDEYNSDLHGSRRCGCTPDLGCAHGPEAGGPGIKSVMAFPRP